MPRKPPVSSGSTGRSPGRRVTNRDYLQTILEELRCLSNLILKGIRHMGQNLTQLTASVARNTDVTASAVVMIHGLAEQIRNATDPAELAALATQLDNSADALAAAITANTPTEPEPSDPA